MKRIFLIFFLCSFFISNCGDLSLEELEVNDKNIEENIEPSIANPHLVEPMKVLYGDIDDEVVRAVERWNEALGFDLFKIGKDNGYHEENTIRVKILFVDFLEATPGHIRYGQSDCGETSCVIRVVLGIEKEHKIRELEHELGHTAGLSHSLQESSIMFKSVWIPSSGNIDQIITEETVNPILRIFKI